MELTIEQALQRGVGAHKEGKLQDAERLYLAILQSQPKHPDANHNLGILAVSVNKSDEALPLFKTALEANPKVEQFWLSYIDALIKVKQFDNANQVLEQAKNQGVAGAKLNALAAQLAAINKGEKVDSLSPSHQQISSLLDHYQNGRLSDAEKLAVQITQEFPQHQFAWKALGAVLNQLGRISESVVAKEKAVKLAPNDAEAHSNLGVTLQELGRLHEAEASCRQAIALRPDYAEAHYNLGNALQELGRLDEAEACFRQAIALKPDYAEAHSNLGNTLKELGRLEEAEASYVQAIALRPDHAKAHYNLGITLQELGRLEEAEASYKQAIALKPDHAEAHNNLGNVLRPLGRLDEAEASYKQAIVLNPDYAEAHFNLGIALQMQGRFKESAETCRQILDKKSIVVSAERKAPITALLSHGRSGTMFFHSLLDGHPDLATLPGVYFKGWFALNSWQRFAPYLTKPDWQENIVRALVEEYKPLFNSNSQKNVFGEPLSGSWLARDTGFTAMGPDGTQFFVVDEDSFSRTLISLLRPLQSITCNYFFELIHRAFEIAIRGRSNLRNESVGHIFYHIHNPNILEKTNFLQHYPEARLLFLTRNPIQSLESSIILDMASARNTNKMFLFWSELVDKIVNMFILMRTGDSDDRLHRGIKLEDIKHNSTSVMPQIVAWMGLPDHPSLYDSSFCGMQYWGPAGAAVSITGFDKKAINHPIGRFFGEKDIAIFETLLWPFLSLYGYTDMDVTDFRKKLPTIRIRLKEPLEFEMKLYEALPDGKSQIQDIGSYKRLHYFLNQMWFTLDKEGTYKAMFQPLKLD